MRGLVVTVAQQKGGCGKTTVTAHLAVAMAKKGYKVAAIDIDPQGSLTAWYDARYKAGKGYYHELNCTAFADWWRLSWEIDELRENYDLIFIDCPPHTKTDARTAVKEADMVIVPIQPSPTDFWATIKTVDLTNAEHRNTYLLLNRIVYNSRLSQQFMEDLPRRRFMDCLGNRVNFATSMAEGLTVLETDTHSRSAKEVRSIADETENILDRIAADQAKISASAMLAARKSTSISTAEASPATI